MTPPTPTEMEMERMAAPEPHAAAFVREGGLARDAALRVVDVVPPLRGEDVAQGEDVNVLEDMAVESDGHDDIEPNPEPIPADLALMGAVAPPPQGRQPRRRRQRRQIQFQLTQEQVDELESMFQETQYPDLLTRRVLARDMNVPEEKVKTWFNNRRAKYRRIQRAEMLRHRPQGAEDFISMTDVEEP